MFIFPLVPRYSVLHNETDAWAIQSQGLNDGNTMFKVKRVRDPERTKPYWKVSQHKYERSTGWRLVHVHGVWGSKSLAFAVAGSELTKAYVAQQLNLHGGVVS